MKPDYWLEKWNAQQIGFHESAVNPLLSDHWSQIAPTPGRVFVPLCGKSLDLLWLEERGFTVVGNELAEEAVAAFFQEAKRPVEIRPYGDFNQYQSGEITVWRGDFFGLRREMLGEIDYVYDRAALIALPSEMRVEYARHMATLVPGGARELLVTLEYDQSQMSGPPFSVDTGEVQALYSERCEIRQLARDPSALKNNEKFKSRGVERLTETVYLLNWR